MACGRCGAAEHGAAVAPAGLAPRLVVALTSTARATTGATGAARPDPSPLGGAPPVGHRAQPGRAAQVLTPATRFRVDRQKVVPKQAQARSSDVAAPRCCVAPLGCVP